MAVVLVGPQAAYAIPARPATAASADPLAQAKATLGPLLNQLHTLYVKTEQAIEKYNSVSQQLKERQAEVAELALRIAEKQGQLAAGAELATQLASAQYRNGQLSGYAELLLSTSPYEALDRGQVLQTAGDAQAALVASLQADQAALDDIKTRADASLAEVMKLAKEQQADRDSVQRQLDAVEQLVTSLTGAERALLEQLEKEQADQAQLAFLASGVLGKGERAPSAAGRKALLYAFQQLGKPYVWGGAGPDVFDCSGLTSQAWRHAGVGIPRTSQEQWARLRHIPLNRLRPGDLIIYFSGATHVAIYIGAGLILQAPRPGAFVKVSPIASMAILGAVRPDPGSPSVGTGWKLPDIPGGTGSTTPILGADVHDGGKPAKPAKPATPTPAPTPSGSFSAKPIPSPSAPPSPTPSASATPSPSPSPSAGGSAQPTDTASPTASSSPSLG
jgi:cell wall-associated NlpC family hydrolase